MPGRAWSGKPPDAEAPVIPSRPILSAGCVALLLLACGAGTDPDPSTGSPATGGSLGSGGSSASGGSVASGAADSGGSAGSGGAGVGGGSSGGAPSAGGSSSTGGTGAPTSCTAPVFVTSDTNGGYSVDGYYVHNNMWNSSVTLGPETLYACSYDSWYVVSNQTNEAGAVKTYPNVHKDYADVPIDSFSTLTSTFAATSPHVGIYNVAYDIWTNGVATEGSTEIMIWTENFNQVPSGSTVATHDFGGRTYDVWKTPDNHYIAFVPVEPVTSGTLDLLELLRWLIEQGWLPASSTLGQICFGVEIVDTAGQDATFTFTDFSLTDH